MKRSSKVIIGVVTAVGITAATASYVSAGPWGGCFNDGPRSEYGYGGHGPSKFFRKSMWGGGPSTERHQERVEYLKFKIKITPDQEPAWQQLENALNAKMEMIQDRFQERRDGKSVTLPNRSDQLRSHADQMNKIADAFDNLYAQLNDEQKASAEDLHRMIGPKGRRW